jgi:hypothetical protein
MEVAFKMAYSVWFMGTTTAVKIISVEADPSKV